jgi:mRNA interferase MazF
LAVLCPITNQAKGYPYEVELPDDLEVTGVVLADQVKNMAWQQRKAAFICDIPSDVLDEVLEKLLTLIDPAADANGKA